jgi:3D (Asp-Asp-Asp) domain-containing protein
LPIRGKQGKFNETNPATLFLPLVFAITTLSSTLYAQATKGSYTTTDNGPLPIRPGSNYELIATLPKGIQINVIGPGSRIAVQTFASGLFAPIVVT